MIKKLRNKPYAPKWEEEEKIIDMYFPGIREHLRKILG
jgi:hypothetical protein